MHDDLAKRQRRPPAWRRHAMRRAILALWVTLGAARMAGAADAGHSARASTASGSRPPAPAAAFVSTHGDAGVSIELTDVRVVLHSRITAILWLGDNGQGEFRVSRTPPTARTAPELDREVGAGSTDTSACDYPPEAWVELLRAAGTAGLLDGRAEAAQRAAAARAEAKWRARATPADSLKELDPGSWNTWEPPNQPPHATIRVTSPRDTTRVVLQVNPALDPPELLAFYWKLVEFANYCDPARNGAR